ncbi:MAG: hypothetical protein ABSF18_06905 [Gammaproteobacteria bacterium]|jgi:polyhydroxyalkanoate synthesis regulator phasin
MHKILQVFIALLTLAFFTSAFAVEEAYVQSQAQAFMQDLQAKTTLTAEQQTQMKQILTHSINERENAIAKYQRNIRNDLEAINATTQSEVQKVLNDQQYKAFLEVQDARKQQIRQRIESEF